MRYVFLIFTMLCLLMDYTYAKDPTQPIPYSTSLILRSTGGSLQFEGTISGAGRLLAIINGESRAIGDQIGQWTILSITTDKVMLRDAKQNLTIEIGHVPKVFTKAKMSEIEEKKTKV